MNCLVVAKERAVPDARLLAIVLTPAILQALGKVYFLLPFSFFPSAFVPLQVPDLFSMPLDTN